MTTTASATTTKTLPVKRKWQDFFAQQQQQQQQTAISNEFEFIQEGCQAKRIRTLSPATSERQHHESEIVESPTFMSKSLTSMLGACSLQDKKTKEGHQDADATTATGSMSATTPVEQECKQESDSGNPAFTRNRLDDFLFFSLGSAESKCLLPADPRALVERCAIDRRHLSEYWLWRNVDMPNLPSEGASSTSAGTTWKSFWAVWSYVAGHVHSFDEMLLALGDSTVTETSSPLFVGTTLKARLSLSELVRMWDFITGFNVVPWNDFVLHWLQAVVRSSSKIAVKCLCPEDKDRLQLIRETFAP
jgi:hypothetical protein